MTRVLVAVLHTFLAGLTLAGAALWSAQVRLNLTWEQGFYGAPSVVTGAALLAVALAAALGTAQLASALGWAAGRAWAGAGLLGVSLVLVLITPPPLRWLVMAGALSIGVDLWLRQPRPPAADADLDA